jgi:hypothetical protein
MLVRRSVVPRNAPTLRGDADGYFFAEPPQSIGVVNRAYSSVLKRVSLFAIAISLMTGLLVGFASTAAVHAAMRAANPNTNTFEATIGTMVVASIAGAALAFLLLRRVLPFYGENVFVCERGIARLKITFGRAELSVLHYDVAVAPVLRKEHRYKNHYDEWLQWGGHGSDCFELRGRELIAAAEWAWQSATR